MCLYLNVYDAYLFLEISKNKNIEYLTYYINNDCANAEIQKTSFPKESVENADFYEPISNKIMTTIEKCMKFRRSFN